MKKMPSSICCLNGFINKMGIGDIFLLFLSKGRC